MTDTAPRKRRVGIVGFFGWGNFGDELFVLVHRQFLADDFDVVVMHDLIKKPYYSRPVAEVVESVDAIVIGGGDLIIPWSLSELYWKQEYLERPVFLVGMGVPRWGGYSSEVVAGLRTFVQHPSVQFISARDLESRDWIIQHLAPQVPVVFGPDIVCALDLPPVEREPKTFGIVTRKRKAEADNYYWVERLCEKAACLDYRIVHLVLGIGDVGRQDEEAASLLRLPGKTLVRSEDLHELCAAIGRCTAMASMKFHGSVVAAMYGTPSIVLSATDKNRNFMKMIDRPELLSGLADPHLPERFSPYTPSIPSHSRDWLRAGATTTMHQMTARIREVVGSARSTEVR